ncbi:hypothetical protein D3C74_148950 [compost metagenome]
MRNILVQIRGNEDKEDTYSLDYLSCYEKPLGIALDGLYENSSSLFYIYLKLFSSYNTSMDPINGLFEMAEMILPKIGFILHKHQPKNPNDIHAIIKSQIDIKRPVFVSGNQKEIPYSIYYKDEDWPHLYLIYGYDDDKELYFIIDGTQNRRDISQYTDFVLESNILQKSYTSFVETFHSELLYSIQTINLVPNQFDCYKKMLEEAEVYINKQPFKELDIMKGYYDRITELTENEILSCYQNLLQIIKNKKVMFNEMIKVIKLNAGNTYHYGAIEELSVELFSSWNKVIVNYIMSLYRRKKLNIQEVSYSSIKIEKKMKDLLMSTKIIKSLTETPSQWLLENNKDSIIKINSENSMEFNFSTNKVYNTWVNDDSPKAFFRNNEFVKGNFVFQTILSFDNFYKNPFFHGGIIFRTTTGMLYFWGVHCSNTLILTKIGENTPMIIKQINSNAVKLQIKRVNRDYYFGHSEITEEEIKEIYMAKKIDDIYSLGLGCKTWEESSLLTLHFSNIQLNKL